MNVLAIHALADDPDFDVKDFVSMAIVDDEHEAVKAKEMFLRIPEIDPNTSPFMALWDHRIVKNGWIYLEWYGKFRACDEHDEFFIHAFTNNPAFRAVVLHWSNK